MYHIGKALLFLGMMFFSMDLIIQSGVGLENNELFRYLLNYFQDRPIISFCMSAVLTALIHSSNATIALIMSLMLAKGGNLSLAIPWVLGANVGTTATAFFGSFKSGHLGKQAALGNFLCKVVGVALILPMLDIFEKGVLYFGGDIQRQIANAHTLLNVFIAVLFFPFIHWGVLLVKKLIPENKEEGPFHFKYLDTKSLETPELALAQAQREILRLSDIVEKMVEKCACLFRENDQKLLESLKSMDQVADYLNKGIKMYLTKLSQSEMSSEQVQREFELLLRTNDLENIGDIVDKNILELARKKIKKGYSFSKEGWQEVSTFHLKVLECLQLSTNYFNSKDPALTSKLYLVRQQIEDMMIDFSEQHVQRLHRGVKESLDTSSIHLDLLGYFQRISDLATSFIRMQNHKQEILLTEPEFHGAKNWNP
jgi:phosphate:Na+ symporter